MKITIETAALSRALKNAMLFASKDECRPTLCCIRVDATKEAVLFEVTDAYAIVRQTIEVNKAMSLPKSGEEVVFVHRDGAEEMLARLKFVEKRQKHLRRSGVVPEITVTVKEGDSNTPYIFALDECSNFGYDSHIDWPNSERLWTTNEGKNKGADVAVAPWFHQKIGRLQTGVRMVDSVSHPMVMRPGETDLKPVYFWLHGTKIEGLVMPVRMQKDE